MTPKEKAKELFDKFCSYSEHYKNDTDGIICWNTRVGEDNAKKCALICVEEILEFSDWFGYCGVMYDHPEKGRCIINDDIDPSTYWQSVKEEINKL